MEVFRKDQRDNNESDRDKCREYRKDMAKTKKEIQTAQENKDGSDVLDKLNLRFRKLQEGFNKACKAISDQTAKELEAGTVQPVAVQLEGTEATEKEKDKTQNVKEGIIKLNVDDKNADKTALENLSKKDLKKEKLEKEEKKTKESSEEKKETIVKQSDKVLDVKSTWKEEDAEQEEAKELGSKSTDRQEKSFVEKETVTESKKKSES